MESKKAKTAKKVSKPRVKKAKEYRVLILGSKINRSLELAALLNEGFTQVQDTHLHSELGEYVIFAR